MCIVFAVVIAERKVYFPTVMLIMLPSNLRLPNTVSGTSTLVLYALLKCLVCINKMMSHCCQTLEIALVFNIDFKTAAHDLLRVIIWTVKHNVIL